jgi:hypothetical protein
VVQGDARTCRPSCRRNCTGRSRSWSPPRPTGYPPTATSAPRTPARQGPPDPPPVRRASNLAYRDHDELVAGFTQILAGAAAILRPGGIVAITARPYRRHGELIDIPGMVVTAGLAPGLRLREECAALIAGVRDGRLIPRAYFFQQKNVRAAIADGEPQWLLQHEDVVVFVVPLRLPSAGADETRRRRRRPGSGTGQRRVRPTTGHPATLSLAATPGHRPS